MIKLSQAEKNEINKFLDTQKPLSKKVAHHFVEIGEMLGIGIEKLEEFSFSGATIGYMKYLEKHPKKELDVVAYTTWWMRHGIHTGIVQKALIIGKKNPRKAEQVLLKLLES